MQILETSDFEQAILTCGSGDTEIVLYQYFQPSDSLPDPSGPLSASVILVAIKDANKAVTTTSLSVKGCFECELVKLARGCDNVQAHTKIKIRKFLLKALQPFVQKVAPPKISRYTVCSVAPVHGHMCRSHVQSLRGKLWVNRHEFVSTFLHVAQHD